MITRRRLINIYTWRPGLGCESVAGERVAFLLLLLSIVRQTHEMKVRCDFIPGEGAQLLVGDICIQECCGRLEAST